MADAILSTGQVISLGDGRLACDIGEIYECIDLLLNENITTIGLIAGSKYLEPFIVAACPWVKELPEMPDLEGMDGKDREKAVYGWVEEISAKYGESHFIPDPSQEWNTRTLIDDLEDIHGLRVV